MKPMVANIFKDLVLVFGILFIVWGLWQVQDGKISHGVGTEAGPIDTQVASSGSMIFVHTKSNDTTVTRVISLESREAVFQNGSLTDLELAAGGVNSGGKGTNVNLNSWPSGTPTAYRIVVLDENEDTANIANIEFTVTYTLWMPNFTLIFIGIFMIFMFFVFRAISKVQTREMPIDLGERPEPAPPVRAPPARAAPPTPPARVPPSRTPQPPARAPPARAPPPVYEEPPPEEYYPPEEEPAPEPEYEPPPPPARAPPPAAQKPVGKIRCSACGEIIPIFTKNRPVRITCSNCGRSGTLK